MTRIIYLPHSCLVSARLTVSGRCGVGLTGTVYFLSFFDFSSAAMTSSMSNPISFQSANDSHTVSFNLKLARVTFCGLLPGAGAGWGGRPRAALWPTRKR